VEAGKEWKEGKGGRSGGREERRGEYVRKYVRIEMKSD
jgi:hypothetical protein